MAIKVDKVCSISVHKPTGPVVVEASGNSIRFENRCKVCGQQLPMPRKWVEDRMEFEKHNKEQPDLTFLIGC